METNAGDEVVLACLRSAMLVWRPDPVQGTVYNCSKEEWCKDLKSGSHRMKSCWLQDRVGWLDAEGPTTVKTDLSEADYVDAELAKILDGQILIRGQGNCGC